MMVFPVSVAVIRSRGVDIESLKSFHRKTSKINIANSTMRKSELHVILIGSLWVRTLTELGMDQSRLPFQKGMQKTKKGNWISLRRINMRFVP